MSPMTMNYDFTKIPDPTEFIVLSDFKEESQGEGLLGSNAIE